MNVQRLVTKTFANLYETRFPHSLEAEMALLGAMILDPKVLSEVQSIITGAADFYSEAHGAIYSALVKLYSKDPESDLVDLVDALRDQGQLDLIAGSDGGKDYVAKLAKETPSSAGAARYARTVAGKAKLRRLIDTADQAMFDALHANGDDPSEVCLRAADRIIKATYCRDADRAGLTALQLCKNFPNLPPPLIQGLMRRTETTNLFGNSKSKKSWLLMDMLLAVATGTPWLGFPTVQGRVLLLDNELNLPTLSHRLRTVAVARDLSIDSVSGSFTVRSLRGDLLDIYQIERLLRQYRKDEFVLVGLDALYRFLPAGDNVENSNGAMTKVYNQIDYYAGLLGAAFVMTGHTSKGGQADKAITDVGAGAGAQSRAADNHIILRPHKQPGAAVLEGALRSWPPFEPTVLQWAFPVWQPALGLDPTQLQERGRARPGGKAEPGTDWQAGAFVKAFVTEKPQLEDVILEAAAEKELSRREGKRLLRSADGTLAFRWGGVGRIPLSWSTTPPLDRKPE